MKKNELFELLQTKQGVVIRELANLYTEHHDEDYQTESFQLDTLADILERRDIVGDASGSIYYKDTKTGEEKSIGHLVYKALSKNTNNNNTQDKLIWFKLEVEVDSVFSNQSIPDTTLPAENWDEFVSDKKVKFGDVYNVVYRKIYYCL